MSKAIEAALAEGIGAEHLAVAAHEIGHLLAWRAGGFPAGPARLRTGLFGGVSSADCAHNAYGRVHAGNVEAFLVGSAAGAAAQERCARLYLRGRHRRGGDSHDRAELTHLRKAYPITTSWSGYRRQAAALLDRRARRLDELTAQLARHGTVRA